MIFEPYNSLAALLSYPEQYPTFDVVLSEDAPSNQNAPGLRVPVGASESKDPCVAGELSAFRALTCDLSLSALQELFIQTFDLSPLCSLEMGWHLFGENYDRGLLLVKIRQLLRAHGVPEGTELPDHLTYALRLVPRMERIEAEYFVEAVVLPALGKMMAALEGKDNPYTHVLLAASNLLHADFREIQIACAAGGAELRVLA